MRHDEPTTIPEVLLTSSGPPITPLDDEPLGGDLPPVEQGSAEAITRA